MRAVNSKKKGAKPVKLHPVKESEFGEILKDQSEYLKNYVETSRSNKKAGEFFLIRTPKGRLEEVIFITDEKPNIWTYAALPKKLPLGEYEFSTDLDSTEATNAVIGWELGTYYFDRYKADKCEYAKLVTPKNASIEEAQIMIEAIELARNLINTPPADLGPKELAHTAEEIAKENKARQIIIHKDTDLLEQGYNAIYAVGKGSSKRPKLVDIRWGNAKAPKVTIIGKGVTFDTGGLNLKSESNMALMKKDMGGAAVAIALSKMIMESKLNINLRLMIPTVENSVSGESYRPSDIIKTRSGKTVEITNTDAEGRVVLCEPLAEADNEKPDLLIDFATLTGAARISVGAEIGTFMTDDDKLAAEIMSHANNESDPLWRMPMWDEYSYMLKSKVADLVNSPDSGNAGGITAALFLKAFVKKTKSWVHFDMMCWNTRERAGRPVGGEAMALRAMFALLKKRYS